MKHLATFLYWLAAVFALALILVSFDYRFGRALFLATSLLPGMFCAKFFLPMALRAERRRVLAVICDICDNCHFVYMHACVYAVLPCKGVGSKTDSLFQYAYKACSDTGISCYICAWCIIFPYNFHLCFFCFFSCCSIV